jgi:hypothetical protein
MENMVNVVIILTADQFDNTVAELIYIGLRDVVIHKRFFTVTGNISENEFSKLRTIPGVISVREEKQYKSQHEKE